LIFYHRALQILANDPEQNLARSPPRRASPFPE